MAIEMTLYLLSDLIRVSQLSRLLSSLTLSNERSLLIISNQSLLLPMLLLLPYGKNMTIHFFLSSLFSK